MEQGQTVLNEGIMVAISLRTFLAASLIGTAGIVSGCSPITINHGYVPIESAVAAIQTGKDTKASVQAALGEPTTRGVQGDSGWYYVSYTERRFAFFAPKIISREILAISFDSRGRVSGVNRYGLQDGVIIDLVTRETVTGGRKLSFFEQLLGNVGNFSAENFL